VSNESQDDKLEFEEAVQNVSVANRKAELMLKLNAALRMNNKAVIDE
jgi:hypothetical protein